MEAIHSVANEYRGRDDGMAGAIQWRRAGIVLDVRQH